MDSNLSYYISLSNPSNNKLNGICFYINLMEHTHRNTRIQEEIIKYNIDYIRIDGIKEEFGPLGCLKSHLKTMRTASELLKTKSYKWILVLEDDAVWNPSLTTNYIQSHLNLIDTYLQDTPVIMLGHSNCEWKHRKLEKHHKYKDIYNIVNACNGAYAYIVRKDYINKLISNWEKILPLFINNLNKRLNGINPTILLENYYADSGVWNTLQRLDKWFIIKPELIIVNNIGSNYKSYNELTRAKYKHIEYFK